MENAFKNNDYNSFAFFYVVDKLNNYKTFAYAFNLIWSWCVYILSQICQVLFNKTSSSSSISYFINSVQC